MVNFNVLVVLAAVVFAVVLIMILGTSGFVFFNVFRVFNRVEKSLETTATEAAHAEKRRKALDVVARQPLGTPAYKCRNCGATVDSTAELSPEGKVRCNYCNQWSSIYQ